MKIKAGYKTSEFWFTLVSFIFSGLYLTGLLKENEQKEELITIVSHAVESIILISGQMLIFYKYIKGRTEVKKIAGQEISRPAETLNTEEEAENDTKRTNPRASRKDSSRTKRKPSKPKKRSTKWSLESFTISSSLNCTDYRSHSKRFRR